MSIDIARRNRVYFSHSLFLLNVPLIPNRKIYFSCLPKHLNIQHKTYEADKKLFLEPQKYLSTAQLPPHEV